ncbi:MAG TPA: hypothetical protein VGX23_24915 [Actinocrinis sp.]|nr:hypothetical protein [Actinocrinis sp.]
MSASPRTKPAQTRRALVAAAVPTTMAVLLCTATLAGTAFASGSSGSTPTPCGTASSIGKPATGKPTTGAPTKPAPTAGATAEPTVAPTTAPTPTATPSAKAPSTTTTTAPATPPSPTAPPTGASSGDGVWGWLNGVWQWIFTSDQQTGGQTQHQLAAAAGPLQAVALAQAGSAHPTPAKSGIGKVLPLKPGSGTGTSATTCPTTAAPLHKDDAAPAGDQAAQIPWHLQTPSMTMYGLTFNGVDTVKTTTGTVQVMDFSVDKVEIASMVTYSYPGGASGQRQYNNAGSGTTTLLTNVHLWATTMTASVYGLVQVTLTPTAPITTILGVAQGFTIPIPVVFTDVDTDIAFMSAGGLNVPGFQGYAGS